MSNQRQAVSASLGIAAAAVLAGTASADILMNPDGNADMLVQSFASPFTAGYTVHRIFAQFDDPCSRRALLPGIRRYRCQRMLSHEVSNRSRPRSIRSDR